MSKGNKGGRETGDNKEKKSFVEKAGGGGVLMLGEEKNREIRISIPVHPIMKACVLFWDNFDCSLAPQNGSFCLRGYVALGSKCPKLGCH